MMNRAASSARPISTDHDNQAWHGGTLTSFRADRPLTELVPEFVALALRELRAAVLHQEVSAFVTSYDSPTTACNGCPAATGFSFNVVSRPATNPYSNQQF